MNRITDDDSEKSIVNGQMNSDWLETRKKPSTKSQTPSESVIDYPFETEDGDIILKVYFLYTPGEPGYYSGLPENCEPKIPPEIEIHKIMFPFLAGWEHGRNRKSLEIEVYPSNSLLDEIEAYILEQAEGEARK